MQGKWCVTPVRCLLTRCTAPRSPRLPRLHRLPRLPRLASILWKHHWLLLPVHDHPFNAHEVAWSDFDSTAPTEIHPKFCPQAHAVQAPSSCLCTLPQLPRSRARGQSARRGLTRFLSPRKTHSKLCPKFHNPSSCLCCLSIRVQEHAIKSLAWCGMSGWFDTKWYVNLCKMLEWPSDRLFTCVTWYAVWYVKIRLGVIYGRWLNTMAGLRHVVCHDDSTWSGISTWAKCQNGSVTPWQHCYMCDVECPVVCHDEIAGVMWYVIMIRQWQHCNMCDVECSAVCQQGRWLNMMAGLCDVVCQDEREVIWTMHLNTIPGMMIRHEVVCQLERNVKIFQCQRCYMCDVECVVCQDEIGGRMRGSWFGPCTWTRYLENAGVMWYVSMIRHEVVCQLERNVRIFQWQHCYMCDVECGAVCQHGRWLNMMAGLCDVVCQDERELIWPMHLNAISGKCWCDVVCQDDSTWSGMSSWAKC